MTTSIIVSVIMYCTVKQLQTMRRHHRHHHHHNHCRLDVVDVVLVMLSLYSSWCVVVTFQVNIQVHFAVKHSNECQVYRCSRCSTVFHSEMEWHLHVRVHHLGVARPFRCLFCREGFTTDAELAAHVATHKKPFSCPVCGESFLVEFLLDRHLESHHRCVDVVAPPVSLPSVLACLPLDAAASVLYSQVLRRFSLQLSLRYCSILFCLLHTVSAK